jgi:DNA-binding transcriptional regulator GbsR (MarR family)
LHETSAHALLGSHQDYRQLQEETKQKEESLRTLSHELDEERAQSTTLQLHNEETQSQLNRQSKFLKDVQEIRKNFATCWKWKIMSTVVWMK